MSLFFHVTSNNYLVEIHDYSLSLSSPPTSLPSPTTRSSSPWRNVVWIMQTTTKIVSVIAATHFYFGHLKVGKNSQSL